MIEKPYSKQRWRFFDLGLFIHLAQRVAQDVGTVEYFSPWVSAFSKPHQTKLGEGVPGIKRIQYFFEDLDSVDCFVFPDVGFGDLQDDLRRRGKRVFGMGFLAEKLEADRFYFREQLKKVGLPVAPHKKVKGISALYDHLEKNPDRWVKLNNDSRGIKETFYVKTLAHSLSTITKMSASLDCFREEQLFLVENPSHPDDGVEMGGEDYFNGGYLSPTQYGCEVKGCGYGGIIVPYDHLPKPVRWVNEQSKTLIKHGRGVRSTEIRFGKKQTEGRLVGYFSDACIRYGCPPSGTMTRVWRNITEMIYRIAGGEQVVPRSIAKRPDDPFYVAEIILSASAAGTEAVPIEIKDKDLDRVLIRQFYKNSVDGLYYRIPQNDGTLVAEAIGFGSSLEEAQQEATESTELVKFDGKEYEKDIWEQMDEKLEKADKLGVGLESGMKK